MIKFKSLHKHTFGATHTHTIYIKITHIFILAPFKIYSFYSSRRELCGAPVPRQPHDRWSRLARCQQLATNSAHT